MINYYRDVNKFLKEAWFFNLDKITNKEVEEKVYKIISDCFEQRLSHVDCANKLIDILIVEDII